ncbi:MAG: hypothetical protein LBG08_08550 [Spirochaetaceae bacterium]|jgi:predicted metal-dependent peptidase|nr:hypothetical protein [Spirochaetaceae bacterium]
MKKEENLWILVKSFEQLSENGRIHLRNYLEELLFLQRLVLAESIPSLREIKTALKEKPAFNPEVQHLAL